ncbi:MAG: hypothetical protein FJW29_07445 [Acidobacteria bacterium]|nr:hypothetical protein [Acidobacteriota bacterium]
MRRGVLMVLSGLVLVGSLTMGSGVAFAQEPAKPVLPLEGDAVVMTILIKPDKTADFESVFAKYRESLGKSENPVRKQQLAGIRFYKSTQAANGNAVYIVYVDGPVANQEYDITRIILEGFPNEVQEYFAKYKDSFAGRAVTVLNKVP